MIHPECQIGVTVPLHGPADEEIHSKNPLAMAHIGMLCSTCISLHDVHAHMVPLGRGRVSHIGGHTRKEGNHSPCLAPFIPAVR